MHPDLQLLLAALKGIPVGDVLPIRPGAMAPGTPTGTNLRAMQGHGSNLSLFEEKAGQPIQVPGNLIPFPTVR